MSIAVSFSHQRTERAPCLSTEEWTKRYAHAYGRILARTDAVLTHVLNT